MYCKRCSGDVYVDKGTVDGTRFDLTCLMCGWRTFVDAKTNKAANVILKQVLANW